MNKDTAMHFAPGSIEGPYRRITKPRRKPSKLAETLRALWAFLTSPSPWRY